MPRAARRPRRGLLTSQERDPAPHPVSGRTGIAAAADPGPVALLLTSEARDGDPRRTRAAAIGPVMPRGSRRPRGYQSILIDYQSSRGSLLHPIDELEDAASSSRLFSEYLFPSRHNMDTNPQGTRGRGDVVRDRSPAPSTLTAPRCVTAAELSGTRAGT
ncbi:uncharacterized protein LOC143437361 isoform X4 [Arvicanthis niloticus]|uniref:uncharacterized protein LOC143310333 isoform X4 n=1 Tax=Arvicanthis niloticus TaxID=61156 RepID=UPI00402B28F7